MKQGLGRATRNDHDWAIYVFLKSSFSQYLTSSESFTQFPSNVQHEIEYGVDVSSRSLEEIVKVVNGFRRGKLVEIQFPQKPLTFPEDGDADASHLANQEIDFWSKFFVTRSFDQAALVADGAASILETSKQPGYSLFWRYLKAFASYLRYNVDKDSAGLANAKSEVTKILDEPRQSAWFSRLNRLRQTLNLEAAPDEADFEEFDCIAASWNHLLNGDLRNAQKHEQFFADMRNALVGDDHKQFCHARPAEHDQKSTARGHLATGRCHPATAHGHNSTAHCHPASDRCDFPTDKRHLATDRRHFPTGRRDFPSGRLNPATDKRNPATASCINCPADGMLKPAERKVEPPVALRKTELGIAGASWPIS
jgi:hypothetical protein